MWKGQPDLELLRAWQGGEREAGTVLAERYYGRVLAFFRLRAPEVAEDLAQRTFLVCVEARTRRSIETFGGFLFGVARKQLLKYLTKTQFEATVDFRVAAPQSILTPTGVVALRQEHWLLLRALDALEPDRQVVLALHYGQGLSSREIAEAMETSTSTVTSRLARARDQLRACIHEVVDRDETRHALAADLDGYLRSLAGLQWTDPESQ